MGKGNYCLCVPRSRLLCPLLFGARRLPRNSVASVMRYDGKVLLMCGAKELIYLSAQAGRVG